MNTTTSGKPGNAHPSFDLYHGTPPLPIVAHATIVMTMQRWSDWFNG